MGWTPAACASSRSTDRASPDMAIAWFFGAILADEPVTVYGDGSARRDFTHVHDVVGGILAALDRRCSGRIINLGGAHGDDPGAARDDRPHHRQDPEDTVRGPSAGGRAHDVGGQRRRAASPRLDSRDHAGDGSDGIPPVADRTRCGLRLNRDALRDRDRAFTLLRVGSLRPGDRPGVGGSRLVRLRPRLDEDEALRPGLERRDRPIEPGPGPFQLIREGLPRSAGLEGEVHERRRRERNLLDLPAAQGGGVDDDRFRVLGEERSRGGPLCRLVETGEVFPAPGRRVRPAVGRSEYLLVSHGDMADSGPGRLRIHEDPLRRSMVLSRSTAQEQRGHE
ncbi:MAG: NAD-dependent epimerase/dehydratase family protein [Holophagales bacterium]|nr:NAD-dependent epimerase/dehydratase family protein [Holophagales bacterium]